MIKEGRQHVASKSLAGPFTRSKTCGVCLQIRSTQFQWHAVLYSPFQSRCFADPPPPPTHAPTHSHIHSRISSVPPSSPPLFQTPTSFLCHSFLLFFFTLFSFFNPTSQSPFVRSPSVWPSSYLLRSLFALAFCASTAPPPIPTFLPPRRLFHHLCPSSVKRWPQPQ